MANNLIQIKRTSVSGRAANTTTLTNPGELALNMSDGIMYSTNGSVVFEIGANNTNVNVSNTLTVKAISANGSNGTSGQVLTSNGTASYWSSAAGSDTIPTQNTSPLSPTDGKLYWNSDLGKLILYYDDGDSQQWVEATPTGEPGPKGDTGNAAVISVGTTTTGTPGTNASVTNSGNSSIAVFDFTIPRGNTGAPASVSVGVTTTSNAGTLANVVNAGNTSAAILNFTIPKGDSGDVGGFIYNFSSNITSSTANTGEFRTNDFDPSSATELYLNNQPFNGASMTTHILSWDDSTSATKGYLLFRQNGGTKYAVYQINGTITGAGNMTIPVSFVNGDAFLNNEQYSLSVIRTGDKGDTGNTGSTGPTGPSAPKSITIPSPAIGDSYTLFKTNTAITIAEIATVVTGTVPNVDVTFSFGNDRSSGTTIQANIITSNVTTGNVQTSFTNSSVSANSFVWVTINNVTGTVTEYHASLRF